MKMLNSNRQNEKLKTASSENVRLFILL